MSDAEIAMQWFHENVIELHNAKPLNVTYTQEGGVLLLCKEESETQYWMTILWTNFLNETGYQRLPANTKWVSPRVSDLPPTQETKKPFWKFWR